MEQKVRATIEQYAMLQRADSVAVAVSGGKDSVALLHLLCGMREELDLRLIAVHIHHGIRAELADRDERFTRQLCSALGVTYRCFHFDVPQLAKQRGLGLEECGRKLRYEALESIGAHKIATAHTLSDSVETMLFHLVRGSGTKGLCGIPPVRGKIIRPLIECTSREVLTYLQQHALEHCEDESNRSTDYARNALRLEVIPKLKQLNSAFEAHAANTMEVLAQQQAYISREAESFLNTYGNDSAEIAQLQPALKSEVLRLLCKRESGTVPEYKHLKAIEAVLDSGGQVQINSGAIVRVRGGEVQFPVPLPDSDYCFSVEEGEYTLPLGTLIVKKLNCKQFANLEKDRFSFVVDYAKIKANLICRNRREGDSFFDAKRTLHKSMKKYLNEIAVPPEQRGAFPVFLLGDTVIGTLGSTADQTAAPDHGTQEVLYMYLERA